VSRVFISADIEGCAGVVSFEQLSPRGFEYERARQWMTGEVAAAIDGARAAGATDVVVADAHGNGQSLLVERLPAGTRLVRSWPRPLEMMQGVDDGHYDAAFLVGYHAASTNAAGVLAHTFSAGVAGIRLNGAVVGEAGISAAIAGHFGVPIALVTGDDVFAEEARALLGDVETAVVKSSRLGTFSANTMLHDAACALVREKASAALARAAELRPYRVSSPVVLEIVFKQRMNAELLDYLPIVERLDATTVRYRCADMLEASRFLAFVLNYKPDWVG
jgi:D-amino peptidase